MNPLERALLRLVEAAGWVAFWGGRNQPLIGAWSPRQYAAALHFRTAVPHLHEIAHYLGGPDPDSGGWVAS